MVYKWTKKTRSRICQPATSQNKHHKTPRPIWYKFWNWLFSTSVSQHTRWWTKRRTTMRLFCYRLLVLLGKWHKRNKKGSSFNRWLIWFISIWLGLATNQVLADSTSSKPPFREGIEYRYEWEASMESDSGVNNQVATSTWLRGQLYVITKVEDAKWRSLLKVSFFF